MKSQDNCDRYWDLLNDYADGRLAGHRVEMVESHLASCERCREAVTDIRLMRRSVAEEEVTLPSEAFWSGCLERAAASQPARRSVVKRIWKPAFGLAVASIAAGLALWLAPNGTPQPTEVPACDYLMEHASFTAAQPLNVSSHHVLLYSRCAEDRATSQDTDGGND